MIRALAWRRQDAAVTAIEERDGVAFYVERTSPFQPIQLVRTPGFRRIGRRRPPQSSLPARRRSRRAGAMTSAGR